MTAQTRPFDVAHCASCGAEIRAVGYGMWGHAENPGARHHYARPVSAPQTPQEPTSTRKRPRTPEDELRRFWRAVAVAGGCWEWHGHRNRQGYGRMKRDGRRVAAHRVSWEVHFGPIPDGMLVCHRCDNPPCVRPDHLFLGTVSDNNHDMIAKGRDARGDRSGSRLHPERLARGETHPRAKLSSEAVRVIRAAAAAGAHKTTLARRFGVSDTSIGRVLTRASWAHVS